MRERIIDSLKHLGILLVLGLIYGLFMSKTGIGIPCPIRKVTGFRCPGCGVSHMAIELMQGHVKNAFYANRVLFCLLPILIVVILVQGYRYIKNGNRKLKKLETVLLGVIVVILMIWGIVRNIPMYSYLN